MKHKEEFNRLYEEASFIRSAIYLMEYKLRDHELVNNDTRAYYYEHNDLKNIEIILMLSNDNPMKYHFLIKSKGTILHDSYKEKTFSFKLVYGKKKSFLELNILLMNLKKKARELNNWIDYYNNK